MKAEHLKIFSYITKACKEQQEIIDRSKMILVKDLLINKDLLENKEIKTVSRKLTATYNNSSEIVDFYQSLITKLNEDAKISLLGGLMADSVTIDNYLLYQERYHELFYRYLDTDIEDTISVCKNREQEKIIFNAIDIEEKKLYKKIRTYKEGQNE